MVTRSIDNWDQHKKDVFSQLVSEIGEEKARKFIDFYAERYDKFGRSFLHWKLAYALMDDYHYCKKIGTRWFAVVGIGGTGKTTLLKNMFYFLDPQFNPTQLSFDIRGFIKSLSEFGRVNTMRATFMDEPDDSIHAKTLLGKKIRAILGKARQGKYFLGICATDLTDIPTYIYRKLDVIIFLPYRKQFLYFKNRGRKMKYVVQEIRKKYADRGYKIFVNLAKSSEYRKFVVSGSTCKGTPFSDLEENKYLEDKESDFDNTIKETLELIKKGDGPVVKKKKDLFKEKFEKLNLALKQKGIPTKEIASLNGCSGRTQRDILLNARKTFGGGEA